MDKNIPMGWIVLILSVIGIVFYYYLVFMSPWTLLTIQISAFLAGSMMLLIFAWVGYSLAILHPPTSVDDYAVIDRDTMMNIIPPDETHVHE